MNKQNPFDEYESELLAKARKEIQEEQQAWEALSPAEKQAQRISDDAKHEAYCQALESQETTLNEDDEDDDDVE